MSYVRYVLLVFLLLHGCSIASFAQVEARDTGRAVLQMLSGDSASIRKQFAALARQQTAGDKKGMAESYFGIAVIYEKHSLAPLSLKYFLAATKLAEAVDNKERAAWCYLGLGTFNKRQGNFPEALKYLDKSMTVFRLLGNKHGMGSVFNCTGDVYEAQGNYTEAHKKYYAALNILRETNKKETLTWPYYNIGEIYMLQGRYDSAMLYFGYSLATQQEVGDNSGEAWTYNNIGNMLIKQEKYREAEPYCIKSLAIVDSLGETGGKMNAHRNLFRIYEAEGDYRKALENHKAYTALLTTINNEENTRNIVKHQMQYDFDNQKELARAEQDKKDFRTRSIAALLVLATLIAIGAFYFQRRANKLKSELLQQKEKALLQNEILMKEIHHRVKNNLQVTGILLDLQLANITGETARAAITESITRLNTISLIHHQLYLNEETSAIEFSQFATDLFKQLDKLYVQGGQRVMLQNRIPSTILDIDTAVPMGLILNELITNSYKHAFKNGDGSITLVIEKTDGNYTLSYTDNGPGLPAGFDTAGSNSLGMMIIQSLSKQVGGSFSCKPGSNLFIITFRDAAEMKKTA